MEVDLWACEMQLSCSYVQWYASMRQVDSGKKHRHFQRVCMLDHKSRKFSNKLTLESWIWQPGLLTSHSKSKLMSVLVECGLCFTWAVEGYAWFLSQKQKQVENTWNSFCSIHLWLLVMSVIGCNCQMKIQSILRNRAYLRLHAWTDAISVWDSRMFQPHQCNVS